MRRILVILFSIAPFVAGAIAALSARRDFRLLWMALVATIAARLAWAAIPSGWALGGRWVAACSAATAGASLVAAVLGARGAFGVGAVALVLAIFSTAGVVLSHARRTAA